MEQVSAKLSHLRIPPRKVRLVADLVRGEKVETALDRLRYLSRLAAEPLYKLLRSAISNAEQKRSLDIDSLIVKSIMVDSGPVLKRWMPKARGRADRILRRTSHVTVILAEK